MSARSESIGLALAAGIVIAGIVLYAVITTKKTKERTEAGKQRTQAALRQAEEVPELTSMAPEASEPGAKKVSFETAEKAISMATRRVNALGSVTNQRVDEGQLPGLGVASDSPIDGETIRANARPNLGGAATDAASLPVLDSPDAESASDDTSVDETADAADAAEETPAAPAGGKGLPTPGSAEELIVMQDVQRHLRRLHSLLLRSDIPPAARDAELRRLEAAMDRLSPSTRRSMNALVKKGYTARVQGSPAPTAIKSGESLEDNEFGRKNDRPSDVIAIEERIQRMRSKLGHKAPKRNPPRMNPNMPPQRRGLPTSATSRIQPVRTGIPAAPTPKNRGGIPEATSRDL